MYLALRATMSIGSVGYMVIGGASSKGWSVVGTTGQCDSCMVGMGSILRDPMCDWFPVLELRRCIWSVGIVERTEV